jgi:hypothetical protein
MKPGASARLCDSLMACTACGVLCGWATCAGTAVDAFLRDNMSWLGKATAWARFSAVASQGVVHKGNLSSSRAVLAPYLPSPGRDQPYPEGGSLFALGLIHAAKGSADASVLSYLQTSLSATRNEVRCLAVWEGAWAPPGVLVRMARAVGDDVCITARRSFNTAAAWVLDWRAWELVRHLCCR